MLIKNKDVLTLGEGPTQGLDDIILIAETKYTINFTRKRFALSLHYMMEATVSYLLMLQKYINSKLKNLNKKDYTLCLRNISKDFTINKMKIRIKRKCEMFFRWIKCFNLIDSNDILDTQKQLIKKLNIKKCLG